MAPFHHSQYGHHNGFEISKEKCKIKSYNTKHSSARWKRQSGDYSIYLSNITYDPQNKVLLLFPALLFIPQQTSHVYFLSLGLTSIQYGHLIMRAKPGCTWRQITAERTVLASTQRQKTETNVIFSCLI